MKLKSFTDLDNDVYEATDEVDLFLRFDEVSRPIYVEVRNATNGEREIVNWLQVATCEVLDAMK